MKKTTKEQEAKKLKKKAEQEKEQREILAKIGQGGGKQIEISPEGIRSTKELKVFATGSVDNPLRKYDLYYKGLTKLLKQNLPAGPKNKKAREFIYEEKNTFITRGYRKNAQGIRGMDGRMAYITELKAALDIVANWVFRNGTPLELFDEFRKRNIEKGYGEPRS